MNRTEGFIVAGSLPRIDESPDRYFGTFLSLMRQSLVTGGPELGLSMTLFSLAVSIRAANIVEIGRFKGLSTLALAGALKFNDLGWIEPDSHKQRPDMDYATYEVRRARRLISIDPNPTREAMQIIEQAGLTRYVTFVNYRSEAVQLDGELIDLLLIDGDHSYDGCVSDVMRYVPFVRPGGYFVLRDYFGCDTGNGINGASMRRVIDEIPQGRFQRLLIDTGYQSFSIFHRPKMAASDESLTESVPGQISDRSPGCP